MNTIDQYQAERTLREDLEIQWRQLERERASRKEDVKDMRQVQLDRARANSHGEEQLVVIDVYGEQEIWEINGKSHAEKSMEASRSTFEPLGSVNGDGYLPSGERYYGSWIG